MKHWWVWGNMEYLRCCFPLQQSRRCVWFKEYLFLMKRIKCCTYSTQFWSLQIPSLPSTNKAALFLFRAQEGEGQTNQNMEHLVPHWPPWCFFLSVHFIFLANVCDISVSHLNSSSCPTISVSRSLIKQQLGRWHNRHSSMWAGRVAVWCFLFPTISIVRLQPHK